MLRHLPRTLLAALISLSLACAPTPESSSDGGPAGGSGGASPGAGGAGGSGEETLRFPTVPVEELIIQPGGGRAFLLDALEQAERSVRVVAYAITDDAFEEALAATARRGVEVRVIVPFEMDLNDEARTRLAAAGAALRDDNPAFARTHQKSMVVDDELGFVLNQNLSYSGFEFNREYNAVVRGAPARQVAAIFDADWERRSYEGQTDLVLSPVNTRPRLEALLWSADESVDVAMEVLTDRDMVSLLTNLHRAGKRVRVLVEDPADIETNAAPARTLQAAGVDVRWLPDPDLHAKAVVIDGRFAYMGSVNFTYYSLGRNRELGLITADEEVVARIAATFEQDFASGREDF